MGPASGWRRRPLVLVLVLVFGDVAECAKCPAPTASAGDPSLRLDTNIALIGDEKREFMKSAATVMASVLKQSADKIAVCVNDQLAIMWHGTDEPAAMGCVYSVGEVNQFNNVAITSGLSALLCNYGIKPERVHLNFFDVPEGNCGYDGQNQGEVTPVTAPPQRITTPPSSVTAPVAVAAAAAAQEECVKVCVRETVTKRVVPPIDEISLPVIKYACKRRCGEKQTANAVEKVAENIQKVRQEKLGESKPHFFGQQVSCRICRRRCKRTCSCNPSFPMCQTTSFSHLSQASYSLSLSLSVLYIHVYICISFLDGGDSRAYSLGASDGRRGGIRGFHRPYPHPNPL